MKLDFDLKTAPFFHGTSLALAEMFLREGPRDIFSGLGISEFAATLKKDIEERIGDLPLHSVFPGNNCISVPIFLDLCSRGNLRKEGHWGEYGPFYLVQNEGNAASYATRHDVGHGIPVNRGEMCTFGSECLSFLNIAVVVLGRLNGSLKDKRLSDFPKIAELMGQALSPPAVIRIIGLEKEQLNPHDPAQLERLLNMGYSMRNKLPMGNKFPVFLDCLKGTETIDVFEVRTPYTLIPA